MLSTKTWGEGVKQLYEFMHLGRKKKQRIFRSEYKVGPLIGVFCFTPTEADLIYKAIFWEGDNYTLHFYSQGHIL